MSAASERARTAGRVAAHRLRRRTLDRFRERSTGLPTVGGPGDLLEGEPPYGRPALPLYVTTERGELPLVCCGYCAALMAARVTSRTVGDELVDAHLIRSLGGRPHPAGSRPSEQRAGTLAAYGVRLEATATATVPDLLRAGRAVAVCLEYGALPAYLRTQGGSFGHGVTLYGTDEIEGELLVGYFDPLYRQGSPGVWALWADLAPALWGGTQHSAAPAAPAGTDGGETMIEADTSYGETWAIGVGAVMYDAPNGAEIGRVAVAQRIEALGAPFVAGAVDYTWRMVRILTAAGPGDAMHRGVYVRRSQLTDPRPAEAPAPDCRAALAARDEEWRAWALAGSPGRE